MNINKLIHGPNVAGQSLVDRVMAAKHSLSGQGLAKSVCKATTEELMPPKKKHIDNLIRCSHEPNVSVPQLAGLLLDRSQGSTWVVVYKALLTTHTLMNYGNERFLQYIASNNCSFTLENYMDRSTPQGYDMSPCIRRYARYLNAKAYSYRLMAYDFCKIKKGKEDGILRVLETEKLLKALPVLQVQVEALLEFDVTKTDLTNAVINASFMMLFKDLIRLLACYNDAIINLLAKYFGMSRKQCKEALDLYKRFVERMEQVARFLGVAESVGIDRGDIPDLAKAPSSLLDALETHLQSLEKSRRGSRAGVVISDAINNLTAAQSSISNSENQTVLTFAESSVLASNNPFADLLSSSDATPDSCVGDDLVGTGLAKNPFLSVLNGDDNNDEHVAAAVIATQADPWSVNGSSGNKTAVTGFATEEQFAAAFGASSAGDEGFATESPSDVRSCTTQNPVEHLAAVEEPSVRDIPAPIVTQASTSLATKSHDEQSTNDKQGVTDSTKVDVQPQSSSQVTTNNEPITEQHKTSVVGATTNGQHIDTSGDASPTDKSCIDKKHGIEMLSAINAVSEISIHHNVSIVVELVEGLTDVVDDEKSEPHIDAAKEEVVGVIDDVVESVEQGAVNDADDDDDLYLDLR